MNDKLVKAMEEWCLRILKGGQDVNMQEISTLPKVLEILERQSDESCDY